MKRIISEAAARLVLPVLVLVCVISMISLASPAFAEDAGGVGDTGDSEIPNNGIPVVYLNINEDEGTIEEMLKSPDHSDHCQGTISIQVPEGFHYSDMPDLTCESVTDLVMDIRGRGHSTWTRAGKKPFKIKLDEKKSLFGLKENKHWVLLANYFDDTLIKNRITTWLGERLGFEFTPRGVPVDLVMTGQQYGTHYLGNYYFSENVRVDKNRLNLEALTVEDTDEGTITGGYLVQNGSQVNSASPNRFFTTRQEDWATDTPNFDESDGGYQNDAQRNYIQGHIQKIEDALYGEGFVNEEGQNIHDLMDMESAAKYWLVNEISQNHDAYVTGSTYIYKKRDVGDTIAKLYWGPLWDFDFAWYPFDNIEGFSQSSTWMEPLLWDKEEGGFVPEVYRQWPAMKAALDQLTAEGGIIDQYYAETKLSAEADHEIYKSGEPFEYKATIDGLKNWIIARSGWVDTNIHELDHLRHKVRFFSDGEFLRSIFVRDGFYIPGMDDYPAKAGQVFVGWVDEKGNPVAQGTLAREDMTLMAKYIPEEEATHGEDIAFTSATGMWRCNSHANTYQIEYVVIPTYAQYKDVQWSSSDPDYATVNEDGVVTFGDPGDEPRTVTITGKLKYGGSRDFQLTVINGEMPLPESIRPEQEVIELEVGQQSPCSVITEPSPAWVNYYNFASDNEDVVRADAASGVLTATGVGETQVHLKSSSFDYPKADVICESSVTVKVSPAQIENADVSGLSDMTFTGAAIQPAPVVKLYDRILEEGTDYQLAYSNNEKVGTATITITGIGSYAGNKTATFDIVPEGTNLKTVKPIKKGFRAKWKRKKGINGYQVRWSRNKDQSSAKSKIIKKAKRASYRKVGLKGGAIYYVQVRTYKTVDGKPYFSEWSEIKPVRTRK